MTGRSEDGRFDVRRCFEIALENNGWKLRDRDDGGFEGSASVRADDGSHLFDTGLIVTFDAPAEGIVRAKASRLFVTDLAHDPKMLELLNYFNLNHPDGFASVDSYRRMAWLDLACFVDTQLGSSPRLAEMMLLTLETRARTLSFAERSMLSGLEPGDALMSVLAPRDQTTDTEQED